MFGHVADEGWIDACAGDVMRLRCHMQADSHVAILADVKKKHSAHAMTADVSLVETAKAAEFFLADGIVVTGAATGKEADAEDVRAVVEGVPKMPVLVGSGVTSENVAKFAHAFGLIVGSHFKKEGAWANELDPARIEKFAETVKGLR